MKITAWISLDEKRDPRKKARDLEQAKACAAIASSRLGLSFKDFSALSVLPAAVIALEPLIVDGDPSQSNEDAGKQNLTPNW